MPSRKPRQVSLIFLPRTSTGLDAGITPAMEVACRIRRADGATDEITLTCRIDTADEAEYFRAGGILPYVLGNLAAAV